MAIIDSAESVEADTDPRNFLSQSSTQQLSLPELDSSNSIMRADSSADEAVFSSPTSAGIGLGSSADIFASASPRGLFMPTASQHTSHPEPQLMLPQLPQMPVEADHRQSLLLSAEPTPNYGSFETTSPAAVNTAPTYPSPSAYTAIHSHLPSYRPAHLSNTTDAAVSELAGFYPGPDPDPNHSHGHGHGHNHSHNPRCNPRRNPHRSGRTLLPSIEAADPFVDSEGMHEAQNEDYGTMLNDNENQYENQHQNQNQNQIEIDIEAEAQAQADDNDDDDRPPVDPADWRARLRYCERARNKAALEASLVRLLEFPEGISERELAARRAANLRFDRVREQRLKDRNNEAAKRSRQRKVQRIEAAERRIASLVAERDALCEQVVMLQQEAALLRGRLRRQRQKQRQGQGQGQQKRGHQERPAGGTTASRAAEEEGGDGEDGEDGDDDEGDEYDGFGDFDEYGKDDKDDKDDDAGGMQETDCRGEEAEQRQTDNQQEPFEQVFKVEDSVLAEQKQYHHHHQGADVLMEEDQCSRLWRLG